MTDRDETTPAPPEFDFSAFPPDTLFIDRRTLVDRRDLKVAPAPAPAPVPEPEVAPRTPPERRARKERRRRIDPTTFEKQYTEDEVQFMTAIQRFKVQSGKTFPSHGDILRVAKALGYRQLLDPDFPEADGCPEDEPSGELAEA